MHMNWCFGPSHNVLAHCTLHVINVPDHPCTFCSTYYHRWLSGLELCIGDCWIHAVLACCTCVFELWRMELKKGLTFWCLLFSFLPIGLSMSNPSKTGRSCAHYWQSPSSSPRAFPWQGQCGASHNAHPQASQKLCWALHPFWGFSAVGKCGCGARVMASIV